MKHLVIIQDRPTQFDVPLYNRIAVAPASFRLSVIYTQTLQPGSGIDPELGHAPAWDHIPSHDYARFDIAAGTSAFSKVMELVQRQTPDLVLISGYYPALHRHLVWPLHQRAFRVGLRSDNTLRHSNFRGLKGLVKTMVLPFWLARYDTWHPVGVQARDYLEQVSGVRRPSFLFPYNVDNDWFLQCSNAARAQRGTLLEEAGFPLDSFVVLGILKWHPREDPLTLVAAFIRLVQRHPHARLVLVGDGPLRPQVEAELAPIRAQVHAPGYVPYSALPRLYAMADVFVHPAPGEPWGVSVNEALACGVPVIAAAGVGAADELIRAGRNGARFANGNVYELVVQLEAMVSQADRGALRQACLDSLQGWNYATTITAFEQALELA